MMKNYHLQCGAESGAMWIDPDALLCAQPEVHAEADSLRRQLQEMQSALEGSDEAVFIWHPSTKPEPLNARATRWWEQADMAERVGLTAWFMDLPHAPGSVAECRVEWLAGGRKVLLAAADTFRAAAREQLGVWADRNTVEIVSQEGGDPAAVSFDAVTAGKARGKDVVLVDTAGRLPTQLHLMEELKKIRRVVTKADATAPHEVLLVIDGNTGQNALAQVRSFDDALQLTGLVVTKLDGTAKGGVLAAIAQERPIPVYFIGVGEKLEDLETFNAREFAQALLG